MGDRDGEVGVEEGSSVGRRRFEEDTLEDSS